MSGRLELRPGLEVGAGRYTLLEPLGQGGQASVWRAEQRGIAGFAKEVALKLVLPDPDASPSDQPLLLQEARLAALLHHPNIVQVYDVGKDEDVVFVAMERIHGKDLRSLLSQHIQHKGGPFPWPLVACLGVEICKALHHAHKEATHKGEPLRLVHRDLKPHNILLSQEGYVKLIDFGIAKGHNTGDNTETGAIKGTPSYMSPEQISADTIDQRSDLFSLGSLLYECSSGVVPFSGRNIFVLMNDVKYNNPTPLQVHAPALPNEFAAIVSRLLEKNPDERYQQASDVQEALESLLAQKNQQVGHSSLAAMYQELRHVTEPESGSSTRQLKAMAPTSIPEAMTSPLPLPSPLPLLNELPSPDSSGPSSLSPSSLHSLSLGQDELKALVSEESDSEDSLQALQTKLNRTRWLLFSLLAASAALVAGVLIGRTFSLAPSPRAQGLQQPIQPAPTFRPTTRRRKPTPRKQPFLKTKPVAKRVRLQQDKPIVRKTRVIRHRHALRRQPSLPRKLHKRRQQRKPSTGVIVIDIHPRCNIVVGRKRQGISTKLRLRRHAGRFRFRCIHRKKRLYRTFVARVKAGKTLSFQRHFRQGSLFVLSFPWANVWLHPFGKIGQSQGMIQLPEGTYKLKLYKQGNPKHQKTLSVVIRPGKVTRPAVVRW
ncbi:MAG: serine/threonine protein kinase [Deltaproteobacteria bacterium]|nr:MAG: serine/threonine protein kinase [Deltaproteobacteria bacterium]